MGIRAGVDALEDESLPGPDSEAPSIEVAAIFTCIYRILMWRGRPGDGNRVVGITKVSSEQGAQHGFGKITSPGGLGSESFALTTASHQFINCFSRILTQVQDGMHLFGDGHFDVAGMR